MMFTRRNLLQLSLGGLLAPRWGGMGLTAEGERKWAPLKITGLKVTTIALPDPPLLAASGCHGPYFLRNVIQIETDAGIVGIGETSGGQRTAAAIEKARDLVI